jgi:hypothetical protein
LTDGETELIAHPGRISGSQRHCIDTGYRRAQRGMPLPLGSASTEAPISHLKSRGGDMTEPANEDSLSRAVQLENIVDEMEEKVADEREAEGVPGKPSDRENVDVRVSENEPPD